MSIAFPVKLHNFRVLLSVVLFPGSFTLIVAVRDRFGWVSLDSQTLSIDQPELCDLSGILLAFESSRAARDVSGTLQLVSVLALTLTDERYDLCRSVNLRIVLFEVLEEFYNENLFLLPHAQVRQIQDALFEMSACLRFFGDILLGCC